VNTIFHSYYFITRYRFLLYLSLFCILQESTTTGADCSHGADAGGASAATWTAASNVIGADEERLYQSQLRVLHGWREEDLDQRLDSIPGTAIHTTHFLVCFIQGSTRCLVGSIPGLTSLRGFDPRARVTPFVRSRSSRYPVCLIPELTSPHGLHPRAQVTPCV
jgi:hypothetical protein